MTCTEQLIIISLFIVFFQAIDASIKWLESNPDAESSEYKKQKKELEDIVQPIIAKLYQGGAGQGPPPSSSDSEKDEL